jgi:hypothetical protein
MASVHLDQSLADKMINDALRAHAEAKFNGNSQRVLQEIQQGNCEVCGAVSECIARQVGAYLGQMDRTVKAVFRYEPDYARPRLQSGGAQSALRKGGINLVAWVGRRSAAFNSLSSTLETVVSERRRKMRCKDAQAACYVLDIQTVEETETLENRGMSLVVNSPVVRSQQLWKRPEMKGTTDEHLAEPQPKEISLRGGGSNPESTFMEALFSEARAIEQLPAAEMKTFVPRLQEIKLDLIRRLVSDQPRYVEVAQQWLSIPDLAEIVRRKIGGGQIGGEAAGLVLAACILRGELPQGLRSSVKMPQSFYLGADLFYTYMAKNQLMRWNYQKYKPEEQIRSEYPLIREAFRAGDFPADILQELRGVLAKIGPNPLIVRSSSLLEDSFGPAFAGRYEFILCPNQGTPEENLKELVKAIATVYASTLNPEALLYRQVRGLRDYDERMGVLIQPLQGERFGDYFLPVAAGVALSRNLYRWAPQIRAEDGFLRLVWGLATSAVERASNNPPRLVALSHPTLQPVDADHPEWSFCQQMVDVVDLKENCCKTLPVHQLITPQYPPIRLIAQLQESEYFGSLRGRVLQADIPRLAITFDELLGKTEFAPMLRQVLKTLEKHYEAPVDIGFTAQLHDLDEFPPTVSLSILHCRRQEYLSSNKPVPLPAGLTPERVLFKTRFMVPRGFVSNIHQVVFISPQGYDHLSGRAAYEDLRQALSQLNSALEAKQFICVGPGQWAAPNPHMGIDVSYGDVYKTAALVELHGTAGVAGHTLPDPALGTYVFHNMMEAAIYPLSLSLDQPDAALNEAFFYEAPNRVEKYIKLAPSLVGCLRLIEVADFAPGCHLEISMNDEKGLAVAYIQPDIIN